MAERLGQFVLNGVVQDSGHGKYQFEVLFEDFELKSFPGYSVTGKLRTWIWLRREADAPVRGHGLQDYSCEFYSHLNNVDIDEVLGCNGEPISVTVECMAVIVSEIRQAWDVAVAGYDNAYFINWHIAKEG